MHFPFAPLLATVLLACSLGSSAAPTAGPSEGLSKLAFSVRRANVTNTRIVDIDRARAAHFLKNAEHARTQKRMASSFSVTNTGVTYLASVGVGSPATMYKLIIDTGSSNTWVGADKSNPYKQTSTSKRTGCKVSVSYGSGSMSGTEWIDRVALSENLVIQEQSIGVADNTEGFEPGTDGILGIGPADLTMGTVSTPCLPLPISTVTDNLYQEGTIPEDMVSIYYAPTDLPYEKNGELTFGDVDASKTTSDIEYVPITLVPPASAYWGIDQSIAYGTNDILRSTAGIVDTGTTLILVATDAFKAYEKATGGKLDPTTGLLKITPGQYENLKPLIFYIGGKQYELIPNAQIFPRDLVSEIGGDTDGYYLIVADLGSNSGQGLDFINGYAFLQRFYSVYDTANHRVGFATTESTNAVTN